MDANKVGETQTLPPSCTCKNMVVEQHFSYLIIFIDSVSTLVLHVIFSLALCSQPFYLRASVTCRLVRGSGYLLNYDVFQVLEAYANELEKTYQLELSKFDWVVFLNNFRSNFLVETT